MMTRRRILSVSALQGALSFFFFQAEDAIRDTSVTGVQTCALPILRPALDRSSEHLGSRCTPTTPADRLQPVMVGASRATTIHSLARGRDDPLQVRPAGARSEERRVGKECSYGC